MTLITGLIICLTAGSLPSAAQPLPEQGFSKYYGCSYDTPKAIDCPYRVRTTWDKIAKGHGLTLCPGCDGWAARPECGTIGSVFYARIGRRVYKLMQCDCAMPQHYQGQIDSGLILEVPYAIAKETNMINQPFGRLWVTIWSQP